MAVQNSINVAKEMLLDLMKNSSVERFVQSLFSIALLNEEGEENVWQKVRMVRVINEFYIIFSLKVTAG